jgi:hypothetical protein
VRKRAGLLVLRQARFLLNRCALKCGVCNNHAVRAYKPEQTAMKLVSAGT